MKNCHLYFIALVLTLGHAQATFLGDLPIEEHKSMEVRRAEVDSLTSGFRGAGIEFVRVEGTLASQNSLAESFEAIASSSPSIPHFDDMVAKAAEVFKPSYITQAIFIEYESPKFGFGKTHFRPSQVRAVFHDQEEGWMSATATFADRTLPHTTTFKFVRHNNYEFSFSESQFSAILKRLSETQIPSELQSKIVKSLKENTQSDSPQTFRIEVVEKDLSENSGDYAVIPLSPKVDRKLIWDDQGNVWADFVVSQEKWSITGSITDPEGASLKVDGEIGSPSFIPKISFIKEKHRSKFPDYKFTDFHFHQFVKRIYNDKFEVYVGNEVVEKALELLQDDSVDKITIPTRPVAYRKNRLML